MTLAQIWHDEGKHEGERNILLSQLEHKFRVVSEQHRQRLEKADARTLLQWATRVLEVDSLEEVFK
jgi:hypothetical protein